MRKMLSWAVEMAYRGLFPVTICACVFSMVYIAVEGVRNAEATPPAESTYTVGAGPVAESLNVTARGLVGRIQAIERLPAKLDSLEARVQAIEALLAGDAAPAPDAEATPQPPADPAAWQTPPEFATSCVRCHNATKSDGGVDFTNRADFLAHLSDSVILVWLGKMPKNSPPLSDDQTQAFVQRWKTVRGQ